MDPLKTIMVRHILNFAARRDRAGRLCLDRAGRVPGLSGKTGEKVAGLIAAGEAQAAEAAALAAVARYTDKLAGLAADPGVEFVLRDICWRDGPKAANAAVQAALGLPVTGALDAGAKQALRQAERAPHALIRALARARATGLVSEADEKRFAAVTRLAIGLSPRRFAGDGLKAA